MSKQYDDQGSVTLTTDFSYAEVDEHLGNHEDQGPLSEIDFNALSEINAKVWDWISQGDFKNLDGFNCRSIIGCWIFAPSLRDSNMTHVAGRFGKDKQSLGRWVDIFKLRFPELVKHLPHIKHDDKPNTANSH